MGNVRRVYVEKKPDFAVKAKELKHEVKHYLGIAAVGIDILRNVMHLEEHAE